MQTLMQQQQFAGVKYEGQSFDCGSKIGFLTANVAYAVGFSSEAAFNRAFKREFGEPPATWRKRAVRPVPAAEPARAVVEA
mgnify:CR=1 FL=1